MPVPPLFLLIVVAFHVPVVIVPTVDRDDAEVKLPSVSIADYIVASVVASVVVSLSLPSSAFGSAKAERVVIAVCNPD